MILPTYTFVPKDDITAKEAATMAFEAMTMAAQADLAIHDDWFKAHPGIDRHFVKIGERDVL